MELVTLRSEHAGLELRRLDDLRPEESREAKLSERAERIDTGDPWRLLSRDEVIRLFCLFFSFTLLDFALLEPFFDGGRGGLDEVTELRSFSVSSKFLGNDFEDLRPRPRMA